MAKKSGGRAWKLERASVDRSGKRPKSNKYSKSDQAERPRGGERNRAWIAGYTRSDGTKVKGHYRDLSKN